MTRGVRLAPAGAGGETTTSAERPIWWIRRRVGVIWFLLLFNTLAWNTASILPMTQSMGQVLTMGALALALLLTLDLNPGLRFRPSVVLSLYTVLALVALVTSARGMAGLGAVVRCVRFLGFVSVLWLLTPYWGRRDLLLARCHLRALVIVTASVVAGVVVAPQYALAGGTTGRLTGVLWPIPPPQAGEYAAVAAGIALLLWLSHSTPKSKRALAMTGAGMMIVLLTQTRTALLAFAGGLVCAVATLYLARRRVRRVVAVGLILAPVLVVSLAPVFLDWFKRDQTSEQLTGLTGRKKVWDRVMDQDRAEINYWLGYGLSNKRFEGLPIDSSWLVAYVDAGIVGVALIAGALAFLLILPAFRPVGPARALAVFLVVYCSIASYTEVGLADSSPYVLHLVVAASLLARPTDDGITIPK